MPIVRGTAAAASIPTQTGRQSTRPKVVEVAGYSNTIREPLELVVHGLPSSGKTTLATTLPGPTAWVLSEPGATAPILTTVGLGRVPKIVARSFNEFMYGIETGPDHLRHKGFAAFTQALPSTIQWVVLDTISSLLVAQHANHLAQAEQDLIVRRKKAAVKGKDPDEVGLDKFRVMDDDLNHARRVQQLLQSSGRNILYLAHTNAIDLTAQSQSTTAGRPVIPGQFRGYMEAWASAILYMTPDFEMVKDGNGKLRKVLVPSLGLSLSQLPLVKHKWPGMAGSRKSPDLGQILTEVGEWPR